MIAHFAVQNGFNAVQAPTHALAGSTDPLLMIDRAACIRLRNTRWMRRAGGISQIDYVAMTPRLFRDPAQRRAFVSALAELPFRKFVDPQALDFQCGCFADWCPSLHCCRSRTFSALGGQVIADGVGGLTALAIAAFGAAGAISHGVGGKESASARATGRVRRKTGGGGRRKQDPCTRPRSPAQRETNGYAHGCARCAPFAQL